MPRKSTAAELQAEEAAVSSPLRRSSRVSSGVATRRTSQTLEPQTNTPARATRSRRASAQDSEENVESQSKPATRTRRASMLAEEESQKETPSTPTKRTRKSSVTAEPLEKEEPEKSKPVRTRRASTASTTDEPEEKKPPKTAPVKGRRYSASIESETEVKVAPRTPARATTRRRSSAAENAMVDEVSTPAKRTTRGRKISDAEETKDTPEDVKNPAPRNQKKSVTPEEDSKNEELVRPALRRGRKTSTDDSSANTAPKTPRRMGRRPSITKEADIEDSVTETNKNSSEFSEEEMAPIVLRDMSIRVTPLKKRKILEKVEAELDLSVINESSDDIDYSKHDESSREKNKNGHIETGGELAQLDSSQAITLKTDGEDITPNDGSFNPADETNMEPLNLSGKELNSSATSRNNSPIRKRLPVGNDDNPSPRKSPRLTEKLSRSNTPKGECEPKKLPTPRKPRNLMKENEIEVSVTERSQASFVSSGSDGSFKFHLSNVSASNSYQQESNKENTEDILNSSKESTGSNKENIEQVGPVNVSKAGLDVSVKIPIQEPVIISRVSNVFKSNQKEFSFMEPMEVDEDSIIYSETSDKNSKLNKSSSNLNEEIPKTVINVSSADRSMEAPLESDESSVEFNCKTSFQRTDNNLDENTSSMCPSQSKEIENIPKLGSVKSVIEQDLLETEGSDTNLIIEETRDSVNFSIQPKMKKSEIQPLIGSQRRSKSPAGNDASLIINQPLEQVKVVLLGKSSSPIVDRRKSKSPLPRTVDATCEHDIRRKSKSPNRRSGSRSPSFMVGSMLSTGSEIKSRNSRPSSDALVEPPRSKSKSPSLTRRSSFISVDIYQDQVTSESSSNRPRRSSAKSPRCLCVDDDKSRKSKSPAVRDSGFDDSIRSKSISPRPTRSSTKSPSFLSVDFVDKVNPRDRSKSTSPVCEFQETPISRNSKKLLRSRSKSPIPDAKISIITQSNSPLKDFQENSIDQDCQEARSSSSVLLEQSFEKPKGTEEFIVVDEKISIEPSKVAEDISSKYVPDSDSQYEVSNVNNTDSERTNIQDKTEYHTAIATTNNESEITSVLNTSVEVSQPHITCSEATDYDFNLDSDEDDLLDSKMSKSVADTTDTQIHELRQKLVAELKKSFGKSEVPEDKNESEGDNLTEASAQVNSDKVLKGCETEQVGSNCIQEDEDNFSVSTKKETLKSRPLETEDKDMEGHSNNEMLPSASAKEDDDDNADDSDLTSARTRSSFTKLSVVDSSNQNVELNSKEDGKKSMLPETKNTDQHTISNSDCPMDESEIEVGGMEDCVDLGTILDKINKSRESRLSNEESDNAINGDVPSVDNEPEKKKDLKENDRKLNESSAKEHSRKSKRKSREKKQEEQQNSETIEEVKLYKMEAEKVDKSDHTSSINKKNPKTVKQKPSLDEFASLKVEEYLNSKAGELEGSSSEGDEEESEAEYNEFFDGMAEEGEEETPSEDSNQIIDEGESIGFSSDDERSDDDYDDNDSFICDEDEPELLSGEEYDLKIEVNKKKKSRIIDPSTLVDGDIIKIPKKKKEEKKEPKKRSRIIVVSDSSDEEQGLTKSGLEIKDRSRKEGDENAKKDLSEGGSVILIEDSAQYEGNSNADGNDESKTTNTSKPIVVEETQCDYPSEAIITVEDSKVVDSSKEMLLDECHATDINDAVITEESNSESVRHDSSLGNLNASVQRRNRKSSLSIQENILVDGIKDPLITQRINALVESFCSTVKQGEISLNLSLEFEGTPQENDKKQAINILSDVKICANKSQATEDTEVEEVSRLEATDRQNDSEASAHLIEAGDPREVLNKKNLKRRHSKSLNDMQEEVNEAKRRKIHKTEQDNKKTAKIKARIQKKLRKDVRSTVQSFSIMNQLITDAKNRPKRTLKPTKTDAEVESNWTISTVTSMKPSTSPITKQEKINLQSKTHPKDFKNQMLSDDKRVKRIDTKTLLKKKGAFY